MKVSRTRRFVLISAALGLPMVAAGWLFEGMSGDARAQESTAFEAQARSASAAEAARVSARSVAARAASARDPKAALAALDTGLIAERNAAPQAAADAFAVRDWTPPPPPAPPQQAAAPAEPPPPPQAPPLPFKYLGRLEESPERTVWYLGQGERLLVVSTGDVIDKTYRVEGFEAGQLRFTYLPLKTPQSLLVGGAP